MLAVEKKKKYTVDDYMMLEEGAPFQLINNELITSPSPNSVHQAMAARLSQWILNFLDSKEEDGYAADSMDVVFDENNVFRPDVLYVSAVRRPEIVKDRVMGAPDLAIEMLSPSNASYDLHQKKDIYEKYGVKEYIIIDPVSKSANMHALRDGVYNLHQKAQKNEFLNSLVMPGFSINLSKLFK
jgi:Uma2 family endonuclease